jgi:hypothetical protein
MSADSIEKITLVFLVETALARQYKHPRTLRVQWVPRSVCIKTFKFGPDRGDQHEVTIKSWWLKQNPFDAVEAKGQRSLL